MCVCSYENVSEYMYIYENMCVCLCENMCVCKCKCVSMYGSVCVWNVCEYVSVYVFV